MDRDCGAESICSPDNQPLLVRALHAFRGGNNDELIFNKDDVIVITQRVEGGWWEGTLDNKTGWFPSNYVKPFVNNVDYGGGGGVGGGGVGGGGVGGGGVGGGGVGGDGVGDGDRDPNVNREKCGGNVVVGGGLANQAAILNASGAGASPSSSGVVVNGVVVTPSSDPVGASRHQYHNLILNGIVETQAAHVNELRDLWESYLQPLRSANVVPEEIYASLTGNLTEVIAFNAQIRDDLAETIAHPLHKRRVGGCFMAKAVEAKAVFDKYFSNHPVAIEALDNYREELREWIESRGEGGVGGVIGACGGGGGEGAALSTSPGDRFLTQGLSLAFRRLERFPALLKELERNLDESHIDRGDTQRAISVYRLVYMSHIDRGDMQRAICVYSLV